MVLCWGLLCAGGLGAAQPASAPALSKAQQRQLAALKIQAADGNGEERFEAIRKIVAMGPGVHDELIALLGSLLRRNEVAIDQAARAAGTVERAAPIEKTLRELRAEALANIAKLTKDDDSVPRAKAYSQKLRAVSRRLVRALAGRSRLIDRVVERRRLETVLRLAGGEAAAAGPIERAGKALGVSLANVKGLDDLRAKAPLKDVFTYRLNRRVEAYNRRAARSGAREEARNVLAVNVYREALGLEWLAIDARLVASARAHSKEMAELGYFSHTSPTKGLEGFGDRVKKAGYPSPGGENIALGSPSGLGAFEQWFGSPPHHQNMVRGRFTAIGVGKWGKYWTQNFGSGRRVLDAKLAAGRDVRAGAAGPRRPS